MSDNSPISASVGISLEYSNKKVTNIEEIRTDELRVCIPKLREIGRIRKQIVSYHLMRDGYIEREVLSEWIV